MSQDTEPAFVSTPVNPSCERCGRKKSAHEDQGVLLCPPLDGDAASLFRRRKPDMPRIGVRPRFDIDLGAWKHEKSGGIYSVLGGVFDASDPCDGVDVLYMSVEDGYIARRPCDEFLQKFTKLRE